MTQNPDSRSRRSDESGTPPGKVGRASRQWAAGFWRRLALLIGIVAIALRAVYGWLEGGIWPGDTVGLACGISAAVVMAVAAIYGVRRRTRRLSTRLRLGTAAAWLQLHFYGGGLFLLLVALHAGARWPTGALGWWLWALALWVVLTGGLGLFIQRTVPRVLAAGAATEVHYDRIAEHVEDLRVRALQVAEASEAPVRTLYAGSLAAAMAAPRRDLGVLLDAGGGRRLDPIEHLRGLLDREERGRLDELERLYRAKLDLDTHYTLQQLLRGWLWLHVPASIALVLLVVLHIGAVTYY